MSATITAGGELYEGRVTKVELVKGKWTLIHTQENKKPIAFLAATLSEAQKPQRGDRVSAEYTEGLAWCFGQNTSLVVAKEVPPFQMESLPNGDPDRTERVVGLILDWLRTHRQVTADDVHDAAVRIDPKADPRFIGHGFRVLASRGVIRKIGTQRSARVRKNHACITTVWERIEA